MKYGRSITGHFPITFTTINYTSGVHSMHDCMHCMHKQTCTPVPYHHVHTHSHLDTQVTRAGFDTQYLQVSRYFDSSIPIFCVFLYFPVSNFGSSVRRYFDNISPDLDHSLNSDSIPF